FERIVPAPPFIVQSEPYMLVSIQDRNDNTTTLTYQGGLLSTVADFAGRTLTFAYNAQKRIRSVTDPMGFVTKYEYAGAQSAVLKKVITPRGHAREYVYNTRYQMTQKKDEN